MIIYGGIPTKITYALKTPHGVTRGWHGLDELHMADPVLATPAFAVDPDSKTGMDTAQRWANGGIFGGAPPTISTDNEPISSVDIITVEARAEGGRAYKVLLNGVGNGRLYVDMREDVLLDALLVNGVKPGGTLPGPFVWGRLHTQLRLVRIGSTLHEAMFRADERKTEKAVKPSEYIVGGIYLNRQREALLYMGVCDLDWLEEEQRTGVWGRAEMTGRLAHRRAYGARTWFELKNHGPGVANATKNDILRRMLPEFWQERWEAGYDPNDVWVWGVKLYKKPTVTKLITTVTIDWDRLRRAAVEYASIASKSDPVSPRTEDYLRHSSQLAHIRPSGVPRPEHSEYLSMWAEAL